MTLYDNTTKVKSGELNCLFHDIKNGARLGKSDLRKFTSVLNSRRGFFEENLCAEWAVTGWNPVVPALFLILHFFALLAGGQSCSEAVSLFLAVLNFMRVFLSCSSTTLTFSSW